jgi:hypothetical protein
MIAEFLSALEVDDADAGDENSSRGLPAFHGCLSESRLRPGPITARVLASAETGGLATTGPCTRP